MIFVNIVKWFLLKTGMGNFGPSENLACTAGAWKILWDLVSPASPSLYSSLNFSCSNLSFFMFQSYKFSHSNFTFFTFQSFTFHVPICLVQPSKLTFLLGRHLATNSFGLGRPYYKSSRQLQNFRRHGDQNGRYLEGYCTLYFSCTFTLLKYKLAW